MRLIRIDPARHIHRWYVVDVQATLLDRYAVVCSWGSLLTRYARWRSIPCEDETQAHRTAERILQSKLRRGYRFSGGA